MPKSLVSLMFFMSFISLMPREGIPRPLGIVAMPGRRVSTSLRGICTALRRISTAIRWISTPLCGVAMAILHIGLSHAAFWEDNWWNPQVKIEDIWNCLISEIRKTNGFLMALYF